MAVTAATRLVDDERGHAGGPDQPDGAPDLFAQERREAFGGLVEEQQARVGHQRSADGQHLLLAARELIAAMVEALGEAGKKLKHARKVQRRRRRGGRSAITRFSATLRLAKMPRPSGT